MRRRCSTTIHTLLNEKANILFLALPTLGILIFTVLPLIFMISMAFTSYDHNHLVLFDWVGFENFKTVFAIQAASSRPDCSCRCSAGR